MLKREGCPTHFSPVRCMAASFASNRDRSDFTFPNPAAIDGLPCFNGISILVVRSYSSDVV